MSILHIFQSAKPNSSDPEKVSSNAWNDDHVVTDIVPVGGHLKWDNTLKRLLIGFNNVFTSAYANCLEIKDTIANWASLVGIRNTVRVSVNDYPVNRQHANNALPIVEAIVGCIDIPSDAMDGSYGSGISGYARSADLNTPAVGGYFQGLNSANSFGAYGINTVSVNAESMMANANQGKTVNVLIGIESNINHMSDPGDIFGTTITNASNTTPIVITTQTPHTLVTGSGISIYGVMGNITANGTWLVTVLSPTTFSLNGSIGTGEFVQNNVAFVCALRSGAETCAYFMAVGSASSKARSEFYGFYAMHPSAFYRSVQWDAAFKSGDGSAAHGLDLGLIDTRVSSGGSPSQDVRFKSKNALGVEKFATINTDFDGNIYMSVENDARVTMNLASKGIRIPAGSLAEPSIIFGGIPDTGIYSPGNFQVAIVVNGNQQLKCDPLGGIVIENSARIKSAVGVPNGVVTGNVGDLFLRTDGGAGSTFYVKESGAGTNTGWVAK